MTASIARRAFLHSSLATSLAAATMAHHLGAEEPPAVSNPRATDGDDRFEPDWKEKLTVTVGTKQGDLIGSSDRVLQAAVDYVKRLGGGTVHVLPGTYMLRNAIYLPRDSVFGKRFRTILTKIPSERIKLAQDSDWYDQEVTLEKPGSFRVGDGIVLQGKNPHDGSQTVIKRTIVAKSGRRFKLNDGLRKNLWVTGEPTCASLSPLLTSENTSDVVIENLTLDGNGENNENFNGNYAEISFCKIAIDIRFGTLRHETYNGDGISFQICHDVVVENCHSHDNVGLGVHPGSGSQRPRLLRNRLERNNIGIFWCWGVKFGLAEKNQIVDNRSYGISIGHNDTDNVMRENVVRGSGKTGVLFRDDSRGIDFWANRNVLERNEILDSGPDDGVAIDLQGKTKDITIRGNTIRDTREPMKRTGIRIGKNCQRIEVADNRIAGLANNILDLRASAS